MNYWYIDTDGPTRAWDRLKPAPVPASWVASELVVDGVRLATDSRGCVVLHRSVIDGPQDALTTVRTLATTYEQLVVVVISGGRQTEGEIEAGRIYFREMRVDRGRDASFARCWTAFTEKLASGRVLFKVLEQTSPSSLVALYFVCGELVAGGGPGRGEDWWNLDCTWKSRDDLEGQLIMETTQERAAVIMELLREASPKRRATLMILQAAILEALNEWPGSATS